MKTNFTYPIIFSLILFCLGLVPNQANAQILWDGGGDGTSWDDAANWNPDMVPPEDSLIAINIDATITGTANGQHNRINIQEGATVTLDLDLMLGNGSNGEHGIVIGDSCTLILGGGTETRTFTFNQSSDKQCLPAFNNATNALLHIAENAVINILQGRNGIHIRNSTSMCLNEGSVNIFSGVRNAIRHQGTIVNEGSITIEESGKYGIETQAGTFENNGTITILKADDDCINMIGGGIFFNRGFLEVVAQDSAGSQNNAIAVGTDADEATFINEPGGEIVANSGVKSNGRAIFVDEMGTFENHGELMLTGFPDAGARFYNRGTSVNGMGGTFDLTDGRVNVNLGTFTNMGLLKSTRVGAGVFTTSNSGATNNAFYDYNMAEEFAIGEGIITDNGINLNDSTSVNIDAGGSCTIDLAEAAYTWFEEGNLVDTADATGSLTFPPMSLSADPAVLTNGSYPEVTVTVSNVCPEATGTTSINDIGYAVTKLTITPTVVRNGDLLSIEIPAAERLPDMQLNITGLTGSVLQTIHVKHTGQQQVRIEHMPAGIYLINGVADRQLFRGKFIVEK